MERKRVYFECQVERAKERYKGPMRAIPSGLLFFFSSTEQAEQQSSNSTNRHSFFSQDFSSSSHSFLFFNLQFISKQKLKMVASPCLLSAALAVTQATAAAAATCTCTSYSQIPSAVASCTSIVLNNIAMPASTALDLTKLKTGATVTFEGKTTFAKTSDSDFTPILVGGTDITITASSGAIIDGNGQAYWDGLGSNGGVDKPNKFMTFSKVKGNSVVKNLHIQNWPVHLFSLSGCEGLTMQDLTLDNSAGDAANSASDGLAAAHNSDGFDISTSSDILLQRVVIDNQDDCVAIASGNNITVSKFTCRGGHGLSIGSIGGKSNNNVTNVLVCFYVSLFLSCLQLLLICGLINITNISKHSSPTPPSATRRTAAASSPTLARLASSATSPTPTLLCQASPPTASTSSRTTSTAARLASRPTVSSLRTSPLTTLPALLPRLPATTTFCAARARAPTSSSRTCPSLVAARPAAATTPRALALKCLDMSHLSISGSASL